MRPIMNWKQVEISFAKQFGCKLLEDRETQNKDIDAISKAGNTISIKHHVTGAKTGNVAFEWYLVNPLNKHKIKGNFLYCEADFHADLIAGVWYVFKHSELFDWMQANKHKYRYLTLSTHAQSGNADWGAKKYTSSEFSLVPIKDIAHLAVHTAKAQ